MVVMSPIDPGKLDSFFLFQVPLRGRELIKVGPEVVHSTTSTGSVINADQPVLVHHHEDVR